MNKAQAVGLVLVLAACASTGGPLPYSGEASTTFLDAQRRIADAKAAGADTLASEAMVSAQAHFQLAQTAMTNKDDNRTALNARLAAADAAFARAQAERVKAQRAHDRAAAALAALPPGGAQ
ncbi:MAG: DUF4398 domain-containing protein [Gemmatimonadota bacterium]|nr:DUF4398 domain-containing protein [Gemmatimonadota bacterium]